MPVGERVRLLTSRTGAAPTNLDALVREFQAASGALVAAEDRLLQEMTSCEARSYSNADRQAAGCVSLSPEACKNRLELACAEPHLKRYVDAVYARKASADRVVEAMQSQQDIPDAVRSLRDNLQSR